MDDPVIFTLDAMVQEVGRPRSTIRRALVTAGIPETLPNSMSNEGGGHGLGWRCIQSSLHALMDDHDRKTREARSAAASVRWQLNTQHTDISSGAA